MLTKKTKALMRAVYDKAVAKDGVCLVSQNDLLQSIPYRIEFNHEDLAPSIKALSNEGYFEVIETERKGDVYYCFTLQQAGYDFSRQIALEKRQIRMKIILTVAGVLGAFLLRSLISAIAG